MLIVWAAACSCSSGAAPSASPAPATAATAAPAAAGAPSARPSCDAVHLSLEETGDARASARLLVAAEGLEPSLAEVDRLTTEAAIASCRSDRWADATIRCLASDDLAARATCLDGVSDDQRDHLRARVDAAIETLAAVHVVRERRTAWRDFPTATGEPACDAYFAAVNAVAHCRTLPATVADQIGEATALQARNVVELQLAADSVPPGARARAAAGCAEAMKLLREVATTFACTAPH